MANGECDAKAGTATRHSADHARMKANMDDSVDGRRRRTVERGERAECVYRERKIHFPTPLFSVAVFFGFKTYCHW